MLIVIASIATVLTAIWILLLMRANSDDIELASGAAIIDNFAAIRKIAAKEARSWEIISRYSGLAGECMKLLYGTAARKKTAKMEAQIEYLQGGGRKGINMLILPGYVLQRELEAIGRSTFRKEVLSKCLELYGKKYAPYKASHTLAKMLSYPVIGIGAALALGAILCAVGSQTAGMGVIGIGSGMVLVAAYGIYDELCGLVKKRHAAIVRQFPNVISKLALLVTSGMIMDRAWKETAYSQETELYLEMRTASMELDNLVSPETAYGNFISRCNTKETAKLASAILQNLSKGNAEIGKLLGDMAREVWQERRHTAKRDAEKANSKLMIPTMLLFLAILVMLMVPIAMNFSGI